MLIIASHGRYVLLCVSLCSDIHNLLPNSLRISSRLIRTAVATLGVNQDNVAVVDHPAVSLYFKRPSALLFFQYEVFFLSIGRMCGYLTVITMYKIPKTAQIARFKPFSGYYSFSSAGRTKPPSRERLSNVPTEVVLLFIRILLAR